MENTKRKSLLAVFFWMFFSHLLIIAQTHTTIEPKPNDQSISEEDLIHPGDLIEADVVGNIEYDWRGTLDAEGFLDGINYLENPIYALCRNEIDVAADIAKGYAKILRDPKVVVKILDRSKRPTAVIYGAIRNSQRFQIKRTVNLNELLIVAGGINSSASGDIQIFRPRNLNCRTGAKSNDVSDKNAIESRERYVNASRSIESQYINIKIADLLSGDKNANPKILSGDVITVLEASPVYIIGGVNKPGQITFQPKMTLARAIAGVGGFSKDADAEEIVIFRRIKNQTKVIAVDSGKTKSDRREDILIEPYDIIEVSQNGRGKRNIPPVIKSVETESKTAERLPLRIID